MVGTMTQSAGAARLWAAAAAGLLLVGLAACGRGGSAVPGTERLASHASASELVFSGVRGSNSVAPQQVSAINDGSAPSVFGSARITGPNARDFVVTGPQDPKKLDPGAALTLTVRFLPGDRTLGPVSASLHIAIEGAPPLTVGLYGLATAGEQGQLEPPLSAVLTTLGHVVDVGSAELILGTTPELLGDEVDAPLFQAAGSEPVTLTPIARYSPDGPLPYGWYTPAPPGSTPTEHRLGVLLAGGEQTLNPGFLGPTAVTGEPRPFGLFAHSDRTQTDTSTQGKATSRGVDHPVRVYPLHDRAGALVAHGYIVAFEDRSNGDYNDYVFVLRGVTPVAGPTPVAFSSSP